ncbi:MAG: glycosyltransferase, partial [Planctomycetota bacterium]
QNTSYHDMLIELIETLNLQSKVRLLGAVSEDVVRSRMEQAHLFALASLHEPLGVVFMEAMALELPVVATNAGGVTELITDGIEGYLVPPKSSDAIAEVISQLIQQPTLAMDMGIAGRQRVEKSYHSGVSAEVIARHVRNEDTETEFETEAADRKTSDRKRESHELQKA